MAVKFFKCEHCGNVIQKVVDSKVPVVCCGEKMKELTVAEEGKEFDLADPYSEKTSLATNFSYEDVEYIHSMLGAVEYFTYTEFVYPGSYSDATKTFEPDIKAALEMFKKYRSSTEAEDSAVSEQN